MASDEGRDRFDVVERLRRPDAKSEICTLLRSAGRSRFGVPPVGHSARRGPGEGFDLCEDVLAGNLFPKNGRRHSEPHDEEQQQGRHLAELG